MFDICWSRKVRFTISRESYRRFLDTIRTGNYFPVSRPLAKSLGVMNAALLTYLANVGQAAADSTGAFMATASFIEGGIGVSPAKQGRILARLESRGLVEIQNRAGKRFVRVNANKLQEFLQ